MSNVDRKEADNHNNVDADANEEEEELRTDDESIQNVEDWQHCTRECEYWTVYFRPVKHNNGEGNAMASNIPQGKTVLKSATTSQS